MLTVIIVAIIQGLILGALARLALPGRDPMSIPQTILVGVGGSLIAGVVVYLISGGRQLPGFLASFCGAVLIVYIVRRRRGGSLTSPGRQHQRDFDNTWAR
jgi:uncharacterized membrane protein YeaQ/YmgE (transglycosylase-associated protein family)